MNKRTLTEQEERLVAAWLDSELSPDEARRIEERIKQGDVALKKELEIQKLVRNEFRLWHQQQTQSAKVDLWQSIEQKLEKNNSRPERLFLRKFQVL